MKQKIVLVALLVAALGFFYIRFIGVRPQYDLVMVGQAPVRVEVADTIGKQYKGLSDRDSLPEGNGMLFPLGTAEQYGFTMRGMRFPLDLIWILDGTIVDISHDVPFPKGNEAPLTITPKTAVNAVLEVNGGWTVRYKITTGDTVRLVQ